MVERRRSFRSKFVLAFSALLAVTLIPSSAASSVPTSFIRLADSPQLAHPGVIVLNPYNDQTLFAMQADVPRAPASVLKLLSMTAAVKVLGTTSKFATKLYTTEIPNTYLLLGDSDPWLTASPFEAKKYHRAFAPYLINTLIQKNPGKRSFVIDYSGVYTADIKVLQKYFAPRVRLTFHSIPSPSVATGEAKKIVAQIDSPSIADIVQFTLLWSDNVLADRLARIAAKKSGYPQTADGIRSLFESTLTSLGVSVNGLVIKDGNGLSHQTRISTRTIAELLIRIKDDPSLHVIYQGLPVAGKTGTLKSRFVTDAPHAVGLIRAKTGWIDTSVSLAGYVTAGKTQDVFVVIADRIKPTEYSRTLARVAIDQMLATIAKPAH